MPEADQPVKLFRSIRHVRRLLAATAAAALLLPGTARAQGAFQSAMPLGSPFSGGVPQGSATAEPLRLGVLDVVHRALDHNLGVLLAADGIARAGADRRLALSQLMPNVSARMAGTRQVSSLEAFGLPLQDLPPLVGPFNVYDARVFLTQPVFDRRALNDLRADTHLVEASRHSFRSARDLVVLVAANLYLQVQAATARAASVRAQLATAQTLLRQAQDLKQAGLAAGIDALRAEVRLGTERQRATAAGNDLQKAKLQLARVIGLPPGQVFSVADEMPNVPTPDITLPDALERAYRSRPDFKAAQERALAAEDRRRAAQGEALPSVRVNADVGAIGLTPGSMRSTYAAGAVLSVPIFQGGRLQGRLMQTDADLRSRMAEVEDLRAAIDYDVRTAFLDLQANGEQLGVASQGRDLAARVLEQARDRFAAGVASNVEIVQAQEEVALASEHYIGALYAFNVSKAMLARSLGSAEDALERYLGGAN